MAACDAVHQELSMSALTLTMASPKSLKRSYHDAGLDEPVPVSPTASAPVPLPAALHDQGPYQSSTAGQANGVTPVCHDTPLRTAAGAPSTQPVAGTQASAKKTKLTFEEKELRRIELDFKAREKADEKARKEEEKRVKEIEKVEKRKAKEQLAQAKQEEKRAKEEAKRKQEDEKNKKSRVRK